MPIHSGRDSKGPFYQWGNEKKYYYTPGDVKSRTAAKKRAERQGVAAYSSGYKKK